MAGKELGDQPPWRLGEPIVFRRRPLGGSNQAEPFSVRNPTQAADSSGPAGITSRAEQQQVKGRN